MFYVASLRGLVVTVSAAMITASFGDTLGTLMAPYGVAVCVLTPYPAVQSVPSYGALLCPTSWKAQLVISSSHLP